MIPELGAFLSILLSWCQTQPELFLEGVEVRAVGGWNTWPCFNNDLESLLTGLFDPSLLNGSLMSVKDTPQ